MSDDIKMSNRIDLAHIDRALREVAEQQDVSGQQEVVVPTAVFPSSDYIDDVMSTASHSVGSEFVDTPEDEEVLAHFSTLHSILSPRCSVIMSLCCHICLLSLMSKLFANRS